MKKETKRHRDTEKRTHERYERVTVRRSAPQPPSASAYPPEEQHAQVVYFFLPAAGAGAAVFTETLPRK